MKLFCSIIMVLSAGINSAFAGSVVMTLSDYSTGNTAVYDTETKVFSDNVLPHFQDAAAKSDGTYLYILEGYGADAVSKYDPSEIAAGKALYQYSTGPGTNPKDMVFVGSKAYILLYASDKILVVDPNAGDEDSFKTGEIDIAQWADNDGFPDAVMGFVYNGMVYVVLQRYDVQQFSAGVPVLLTIDPATDTIVDMDEDEEGIQGIDLNVRNPREGSLNGSMLYIAGTTYGASDEGVITIDLENPLQSQKKIISEEAAGGFINGVDVFIAEYGLVYVYDENWMEIGRIFNIQDGTLGEPVPYPDAGGGVIMVDGLLYVCSRDFENPGLHIFSPFTDEDPPMHEFYPTELPPYSIVYVGDESVETSVTDEPEVFTLEAPYPNPFNPSTTVSFTIPEPNPVRVEVFNTAGQKVDTIVDGMFGAGSHSLVWNASSLSSGVYFIRVKNGLSVKALPVTFMK